MLDINATLIRPVLTNAYWDGKLFHEVLKYPKPSESQISEILEKVDKVLADLDSIASTHTYLASDELSIGDIQIYNEVLNVTYNLDIDLSKHPQLQKWYLRISQDPIIQDLHEKMVESFGQIRENCKELPVKEEGAAHGSVVERLVLGNRPKGVGRVVGFGEVKVVYTDGVIGVDLATDELVSDSLEEQVEQSMKNLVAVLADNGATLDDVTKANLYLLDMDDFGTVNEIYARYFSSHLPARAAVAVKQLPKSSKFQIQAEAVIQN